MCLRACTWQSQKSAARCPQQHQQQKQRPSCNHRASPASESDSWQLSHAPSCCAGQHEGGRRDSARRHTRQPQEIEDAALQWRWWLGDKLAGPLQVNPVIWQLATSLLATIAPTIALYCLMCLFLYRIL